jgi:TM2 domain-containing membrane protein YozV
MDCVNHIGVSATAYCQNCGKALCANCVRNAPGGQILCEPCWTSWQSYQQPFVTAPPGSPSPSVAALLGIIPGVGAMYNGQFIKGLIHVVIFAVLVSAAHLYDIFGLFIAAWIFYQSFEAYHTAKARRDGLPLPDPLGLNEVGSWFTAGRGAYPGHPFGGPGFGGPGSGDPNQAGQPGQAAGVGQAAGTSQGTGAGYPPPPYQAPAQGPGTPYQAPPYQSTYQGPYPPPPGVPPIPPVQPVPPLEYRRREPVGAIVLIGLGILFLLGQLDLFSGRLVEYTWPVLLIGLGVWLIVRRLDETKGGSK